MLKIERSKQKNRLQFILEEENPNGIIECSVDDWFGISYKIPRNKLKEASKLKYAHNTGVYILFGEDEETAEKIAYIGEAEDILKSSTPKYSYYSNGINQIFDNYNDERQINLTVIKKLGNFFNKTKGRFETSNAEEKERL